MIFFPNINSFIISYANLDDENRNYLFSSDLTIAN